MRATFGTPEVVYLARDDGPARLAVIGTRGGRAARMRSAVATSDFIWYVLCQLTERIGVVRLEAPGRRSVLDELSR